MREKIHPNPIAKIIMLFIAGGLISVLLLQFRSASFFTPTFMGVWAILFLAMIHSYMVTRFVSLEVTEDEVVYKKGILSVNRVHIAFHMITSVNMQQTFFERIFGLGTLEIDTAGGPWREVVMEAMPIDALRRIVGEIKKETDKSHGGPPPKKRKSSPRPPGKPASSKHPYPSMYR